MGHHCLYSQHPPLTPSHQNTEAIEVGPPRWSHPGKLWSDLRLRERTSTPPWGCREKGGKGFFSNLVSLPTQNAHLNVVVVNLMYSSLFSSVTRTLAPSGLRSWEVIFPRISISTEKYISRPHSSMLLSLRRHEFVGSKSSLRGWGSELQALFFRVRRVWIYWCNERGLTLGTHSLTRQIWDIHKEKCWFPFWNGQPVNLLWAQKISAHLIHIREL